MNRNLEFSIILPVCHGGSFLRNALISLHDLAYPPNSFEVLVAADENDRISRKTVESESADVGYDIHYVAAPSSNRSAKLNSACSVARGRVLVFADDDCMFFPDWLQKIHNAFEREPDAGVVGGLDELMKSGSAFDLGLDYVLNSFLGTGGVRRGSGFRVGKYYPKLWNMAIPRKVALKASLNGRNGVLHVFKESLIVNEDVDLGERIEQLGRRIVFAPDVRVKHCRDTTFGSFVRRNFTMARICRRLGLQQFPHIILAACALSLLTLALSSFFFEPLRKIFLICSGGYTLLLITGGIRAFLCTKKKLLLAIVPSLLVGLHFARGLGYLFPWPDLD